MCFDLVLPISYKLLVFNWLRFGAQTSQITPQLHRLQPVFLLYLQGFVGLEIQLGFTRVFEDDGDDGDDGLSD